MSYHQTGLDPLHLKGAASGWAEAQAHIAVTLASNAERQECPQFAQEMLAAAEFAANLALQHGQPVDLAVVGFVFAVRSITLAEADPVRSLAYREDALRALDEAAATGDPDALRTVGVALNRLADAGDDEATAKLNLVVGALQPDVAVALREVMRRDADERSAVTLKGA